MGQVTYSINGFRQQLSDELKELRGLIESIIKDEEIENDDLINSFEHLACLSNSFNCVYLKGVENFSDMSNLKVEFIEY